MIPLSGDIPNSKGAICENVDSNSIVRGTSTLKRGFAHMLKNGVVMDVTTVEQAQIAEEAGAVSVMVLDKLPSDVRKAGGVARTASIRIIEEIMDHVTIPVMAKCRIGHMYEAKVLDETNVDMIDESEVLTPADEYRHIWKWDYTTPFVNGARSLAEALRRRLYFDDFYDWICLKIIVPIGLGAALFDKKGIDGVIKGIESGSQSTSTWVRKLTTGSARDYIMMVAHFF